MIDAYKPIEELCHKMCVGKAPWDADLYGWLDAVVRRLNTEANDYHWNVMDKDAMQRNIELSKTL